MTENSLDAVQDEVERTLQKIDSEKEGLPATLDDPLSFIQNLFTVWGVRGGLIAGKSRNSLRHMNELLSESGIRIRSFQPKTAGQTRVTRSDLKILLNFIFEHWEYNGEKNSPIATSDNYKSIKLKNSETVVSKIVDSVMLKSKNKNKILLTLSKKDNKKIISSVESQIDLMKKSLPDANFLITVGQKRTIIAPNMAIATLNFGKIMNDFWDVDRKNKKLVLIWVTSIGDRNFGDINSVAEYNNFDLLSTQFRFLSIIKDSISKERWRWLIERVIIVVGGMSLDEIDYVYDSIGISVPTLVDTKPWIESGQLQIQALPEQWAMTHQIRELYGQNLEQIDRRTFVIIGSESQASHGIQPFSDEFRYFAMGPNKDAWQTQNLDVDRYSIVKGFELPTPEGSYNRTFRIVCAAAGHRLGRAPTEMTKTVSTTESLIHLRHVGFAVLRLTEFLRLSSQLTRKTQGDQKWAY